MLTFAATLGAKASARMCENAQLDTSRTCIYWNDRIDLPSDAIYEYGVVV